MCCTAPCWADPVWSQNSTTAKHFPPAAREGVGRVRTHLEKREICCRTALLESVRKFKHKPHGPPRGCALKRDTVGVRNSSKLPPDLCQRSYRDFSVRKGLTEWSRLFLTTDWIGPEWVFLDKSMILIHWVHFPVRVWCVPAMTAEQKWQLCSWTPYSVPSLERGKTGNLEPLFPFITGPQHHGGCSIPARRGCEEVTKHHKSTLHRMRGKQSPAMKL